MSIEHKNIFNGVTSLSELNVRGKLNKENYKMPKSDTDFSDKDLIQSNMTFWKFKEVKEIVGTFNRFEKDNYGEHVVIIDADNEEVHLPNLMALNGKLKSREVKKGDKLKIVYSGPTRAKSGRMYEDFLVYLKPNTQ